MPNRLSAMRQQFSFSRCSTSVSELCRSCNNALSYMMSFDSSGRESSVLCCYCGACNAICMHVRACLKLFCRSTRDDIDMKSLSRSLSSRHNGKHQTGVIVPGLDCLCASIRNVEHCISENQSKCDGVTDPFRLLRCV